MRFILIVSWLLFLIAGLVSGVLFIRFFSKTNLPLSHSVYQKLGIIKPQVIGFQPYWLLERADKNYAPYLTTLTYFGLTVDAQGKIVKLVNTSEEEPGWTWLKSSELEDRLKPAKDQSLTLSLLIHNSNEATISALLQDPVASAHNLSSEVIPLMQEYQFTDLNLDIESFKTASPAASQSYTTFVQTIKNDFKSLPQTSLTLEITPISLAKPHLTDIQALKDTVDYIVLMAYDYHYIYSLLSGPVAPIGGQGQTRELDVESAVKTLTQMVDPKQIILGIPLYGYEWETLTSDPDAPVIPGSGSTASNRRAEDLISTCLNCLKSFDNIAKQPFIIFPDRAYFHQIFYEDEQSLEEKIRLAKEYQLGGVAVWALGYEGETLIKPLKTYKQSFKPYPPLSFVD